MASVGKHIKHPRTVRHMTQEQLAERLGKYRHRCHHRDRPDPAHYPASSFALSPFPDEHMIFPHFSSKNR